MHPNTKILNDSWTNTESKIKENKDKKNHIRLECLIKLCKGDTNLAFKI